MALKIKRRKAEASTPREAIRPEHQGRIGEKTLERWAARENLNLGKPDPDTGGWDYFLQFPNNQDSAAVAFDVRPAEISCKLQVKTVGTGEASIKIKLDHWERMIKEPVPWFVLVFLMSGKKITVAYLVHIGEKWVRAALKRLVKAGAHPKKLPLHKQIMRLTWSEKDRLPKVGSRAFAQAIRQTIEPMGQGKYVKKKLRTVESAGYEKGRFQVSITIPVNSNLDFEAMADFAIGIREELPASQYEVKRSRFGISDQSLTQTSSDISLQISKPPSAGTSKVVLSDLAKGMLAQLSFDTRIAAQVFPQIPPEFNKVRLTSGFLDIIISPQSRSLQFRINVKESDKLQSLSELGRAGEFFSGLFKQPDAEAVLEFQFPFASKPFRMARGDYAFAEGVPNKGRELAEAAASAWWIAKSFGIEEPYAVPHLLWAQRMQIALMKASLEGIRGKYSMSIPVNDPEQVCKEAAAILITPSLGLDEYVLLVAAACIGVPVMDEEESGKGFVRVDADGFRVLKKRIVKRSEMAADEVGILTALADDSTKMLNEQGISQVFREDFSLRMRGNASESLLGDEKETE